MNEQKPLLMILVIIKCEEKFQKYLKTNYL